MEFMCAENKTSDSELSFDEIHELDDIDSEIDHLKEIEEIRCYWCNKSQSNSEPFIEEEIIRKNQEIPSKFTVCSKNHDKKVKRFYTYIDNWYFLYVIFTFVIPLVLIVLAVVFTSMIFAFPIFSSLGISLLFIPLIGDKMITRLGLKNTIILGRLLGVMLILIGVILILTAGLRIFEGLFT